MDFTSRGSGLYNPEKLCFITEQTHAPDRIRPIGFCAENIASPRGDRLGFQNDKNPHGHKNSPITSLNARFYSPKKEKEIGGIRSGGHEVEVHPLSTLPIPKNKKIWHDLLKEKATSGYMYG